MFKSELNLEEIDDRPDFWEVISPLIWSDGPPGTCSEATVPSGFRTDLASIPVALRSLLDRNGLSRRPAVLHDWLYALQPCARAEADATLRAALIADGETPFRAWVYYAGVRIGGAGPWTQHKLSGLASCFCSFAAYRNWLKGLRPV